MKRDKAIEGALLVAALSATGGLCLITLFIFREGVPAIVHVGWRGFFLSSDWDPSRDHFGILSMIGGTLVVTAGATILGVVSGLGLAITLTRFSPPWLAAILKPAVELLAGIPSVVYGFVGVVTLVPLIRRFLGGPGLSVLATSIVLGIMILPTIASIAIDALRAVPPSYREGSLALGATEWQTTWKVVLKGARPGILAAVILGMGRAIGETMAVIMVAGNALEFPRGLLSPVRTLTSNIALEMGYASGTHRQALFAAGVTLFVVITLLNLAALSFSRRRSHPGRLP